jgi:hypothetical protein
MASGNPKYVSRRATVMVFSWVDVGGSEKGDAQGVVEGLIAGVEKEGGVMVKEGEAPMAAVWWEKEGGLVDGRAVRVGLGLDLMLKRAGAGAPRSWVGMAHGLCFLLDFGRGYDSPGGPAAEAAMKLHESVWGEKEGGLAGDEVVMGVISG